MLIEKKYKFNSPIVRRVLAPGEQSAPQPSRCRPSRDEGVNKGTEDDQG